MAEIKPEEIRSIFRPRDAYEEDILWAIGGGRDKLIGYVGLEAVTDYMATVPTDALRASALKRAHGHFAYAVLITNAGSTLREGGRVKRESKFAGESEASVEYETPAETAQRAQQQNDLGLAAIELYLSVAAVEEATIVSTLKYW